MGDRLAGLGSSYSRRTLSSGRLNAVRSDWRCVEWANIGWHANCSFALCIGRAALADRGDDAGSSGGHVMHGMFSIVTKPAESLAECGAIMRLVFPAKRPAPLAHLEGMPRESQGGLAVERRE